jgi:hypothetical protein
MTFVRWSLIFCLCTHWGDVFTEASFDPRTTSFPPIGTLEFPDYLSIPTPTSYSLVDIFSWLDSPEPREPRVLGYTLSYYCRDDIISAATQSNAEHIDWLDLLGPEYCTRAINADNSCLCYWQFQPGAWKRSTAEPRSFPYQDAVTYPRYIPVDESTP